jgi:hypothetical protein
LCLWLVSTPQSKLEIVLQKEQSAISGQHSAGEQRLWHLAVQTSFSIGANGDGPKAKCSKRQARFLLAEC